MGSKHIKKITPYGDVNEVLYDFVKEADVLLGENITGIYLFGSLSYNAFDPKRSDIDLLVVVKRPLTLEEGQNVKKLHLKIEKKHQNWAKRIECSYTPLALFKNILPPKQPRPYYGAGIFYFEVPYGNEWIINNYLLYNKGITLKRPDFNTLVKPIDIKDVQKANIRDLYKEWVPKINDPEWLQNSHYQSYLVLNLCRILFAQKCSDIGSKTVSSSWVKNKYPEWKNVIEAAESWHNGVEMKLQEQAIKFIKFVVNEIKKLSTST